MSAGPVASRPARVVIAEDRSLIREAFATLLVALGIEVVATAVDGDEAVRRCREHDPDVLLMDLKMPHCDGIQATRRMAEQDLRTPVIALTDYRDEDSVFAALEAGVMGYLTKDASADDIVRAIETVRRGDACLDPTVQRLLLERHREKHPGSSRREHPDGLSNREVEVLLLVAQGRTNREIAELLRISEATVKSHLTSIFVKTETADRANLVKYAYDRGLVGDWRPGAGQSMS